MIETLGIKTFSLSQETAIALCIFLNCYYFVSITIFLGFLGPWLRKKIGTDKTLRLWEYYVTLAWLGQTTGFWVSSPSRE